MEPSDGRFGRTNPLATLRQFARPVPAPEVTEQCELCSVPLAPQHRHLFEIAVRQVICACDPCALRFLNVIGGRFKLIPRDARTLPGFHMTDAQWDGLALPIDLAFFLYSSPEDKMVAFYPSPAGATESLLPLPAWQALVEANPVLARMEPDVETLLANRVSKTPQYFLAPIDTCYELVGLVRMHWRGFSGGETVWRELTRFFDRLEQTARPLASASPSAAPNA